MRASPIGVYLPSAISFTSLPGAHDPGGENPSIDTKDVFEASELWATRPSGCWSPLERAPRGGKAAERLPNGLGAAEAKAAALHPKWYQSSLSKLSTKEVGEVGKRSAGNQIGYQVIDRQVEDRQTGRNKADERWYPSRPCSVLNSGLQTSRRRLKPICDNTENPYVTTPKP